MHVYLVNTKLLLGKKQEHKLKTIFQMDLPVPCPGNLGWSPRVCVISTCAPVVLPVRVLISAPERGPGSVGRGRSCRLRSLLLLLLLLLLQIAAAVGGCCCHLLALYVRGTRDSLKRKSREHFNHNHRQWA